MESADRPGLSFELGADAGCNLTRSNSALACPFHVGHINSTMRQILPRICRTRFRAHVVAGADEVAQLSLIAINEMVCEGELIADALRVIHLPGKSAGEIGLFFYPRERAVSCQLNG